MAMSTRHIVAGMTLAVLTNGPYVEVHGQDAPERDRSILTLLPVENEIVVDGTNTGRLTEQDYLVRAGRRVAAWSLVADSVDSNFLIELESLEFDPYLYVVGPNIRAALGESRADTYVLTNDDGGDGLNSRLCFQAPSVATYYVVVGALHAEAGEYALTVTRGCGPTEGDTEGDGEVDGGEEDLLGPLAGGESSFDPWEVSGARTLRPGVIMEGLLSSSSEIDGDGFAIEVWALTVERTQRLVIEVGSDEFEPWLRVVSASGFGAGWLSLGADIADGSPGGAPDVDEIGEVSGAKVCILAGADEEFRIVVQLWRGRPMRESPSRALGEYWVKVTEDPEGVVCETGSASATHYFDLLVALADQGRRIGVGESTTSAFTSQEEADPVLGHSLQRWTVDVARSIEWVAIDVWSASIHKPRLLVLADNLGDIASRHNDCRHRVNYRVPRGGGYPVIVYAGREERGEFALSVSQGRSTLPEMEPCEAEVEESELAGFELERALMMGTEVDDEFVDANGRVTWTLEAAAGDSVTIAVESEDFDTYLEIYGPGLVGGLWDDDGGPGANSRIMLAVPEDGAYEIVVSSFDGEQGAFRLRAHRKRPAGGC